jgi:hypothetical protein
LSLTDTQHSVASTIANDRILTVLGVHPPIKLGTENTLKFTFSRQPSQERRREREEERREQERIEENRT